MSAKNNFSRLSRLKGFLTCKPWATSLVVNTSLTIFLVGIGLSLFFAACSLLLVRNHETERQIHHIEDLLSAVGSTVRIACFVGDTVLAEEIARGLLTNSAVAAVRITAGQVTLVDTGKEKAPLVRTNPVVRKAVTSPFNPNESVGEIELIADAGYIEAQVGSYSRITVVVLLFEALAVAFVVGLVVLARIVRPIKVFSDDLHRGRRPVPRKSNQHNEIGMLARDVNAMMLRTASLLDQEKTMRAEIAQNEQRLRTLVDNSPDMIVRYDTECRRIFVNPAYARETGIPLAVALDSTVDDSGIWRPFMPLEEFRRRLRAVMATGRSDQVLLEWINDTGVAVSHEMYVVAERAADGRTVGALAIGRNVTERKAIEQQLIHQATHDALTGLPNRVLLKDRLQQALARVQRENQGLAVLFVDLDNFKGINDTLGHDVGDELLQIVAQRMRNALRGQDTVARLGGDEFVVILEGNLDVHNLDLMVRKVFEVMSSPCLVGEHRLYPAASVGIAVYPQDGKALEDLMRNADTAMYAAKGQGRNCYRFFSSDMNDDLTEWMDLSNSLRHALERGEFELNYQPQANLGDGKLIGLEALLRWRHPERGLISPARFIPVAEECGLIIALGDWVLREACRQYRAWLDAGLAPAKIAVNLSAVQCQSEDLLKQVRQALDAHRLGGDWLEVEVTESVALAPNSIHTLNGLREMGVRIAMDDFGTGYSSLSYIKRLPINSLKVDRTFVADMDTNPSDVQIVRAIIAMAHSLGLRVCAEGVETETQLEALRQLGCDEIQGYLLSRPMPAEGITTALRDRTVWHCPQGEEAPGRAALSKG